MRRLTAFGIVLLLAFSSLRAQQPPIQVNLTLLNPTPYIGDWESSPGAAMMTVTNGTGVSLDVSVTATLKKNGVTAGTAPSNIISIKNGVSVFPSAAMARWSDFSFAGGIQTIVNKTGRLPEGWYELQVTVANSTAGRTIAGSDSKFFSLSYPQPPQLLIPADKSDIMLPNPTFQWTPVMTTGQVKAKYILKIVEVLSGQTPKQAIDANVPNFEGAISPGTSKLYPPSALPLAKGKRYAWQVQAVGSSGASAIRSVAASTGNDVPLGANNGKSEIWTFTYPSILTFAPVTPPSALPEKEKQQPPAQYQLPFNTYVKGKLFYNFPSITGWAIPSSAVHPLKNTSITFVQKLAILEKSTGKMVVIPSTVWDKELGVTTTDETGDFMFACMMTDSMKLLFKNRTWTINGKSVFGDLYRVGRIHVDNPYYCSPDDEINAQPGQTKLLFPMIVKARSYVLSLKIMPDAYEKEAQYVSGPMSGIIVYLLRKTRPVDAPDMEGRKRPVPTEMRYGMEVISKDTTTSSGLVNLVYLTKNIGPNDSYYIDAEPDPKGDKNYTFWGPVEYRFAYTADKAVYSGDYTTAMDFKTITMHPWNPKVEGLVYRADNPNQPVAGAHVKVLKLGGLLLDIEQSMLSFANGSFKFLNLGPVYDNNDHIVGPQRDLYIGKYGFRDTILQINNAQPLKLGQQVYFEKILLQPAAQVHGAIVNEDGHGINAKVTVGNGSTVDALHGLAKKKNSMGDVYFEATPAEFECPAVLGMQKLIIDPTDKSYFTDTLRVTITQANQDLGTYTLKKKLQRIQVQVYPEVPPGFVGPVKGLKSAGIKILPMNPPLNGTTNDLGIAEFKFMSSGDNFSIKVSPPSNLDFEGKTVSVSAPASKDWTVVKITLKKAAKVAGRVFAGRDLSVSGARVFIDQAGSSGVIETKTDASGAYVLRNVPFGKYTMRAVKGGNFIGDSVRVNITAAGVRLETITAKNGMKNALVDSVNFLLKIYEGMDITKLLGFPIEVTSLKKAGSETKISGNFVQLPPNSFFAPDTNFDCKPGFTNVTILPGAQKNGSGIPFAAPKNGSVTTDRNYLDLTVNQKLIGRSEDAAGIKIADIGNGIGALKGKVFLNANSFKDPSIKFAGNGFYLANPKSADPVDRMRLPAIIAAGIPPIDVPDGFLAVNQSGGSIQYELFGPNGFAVKADSGKSFLKDDAVRLASTLRATLQNVSPAHMEFDIGDVVLHADQLDAIHGTKKITIPLEQWSLESEEWTISKTGGFVLNGALRTGKVAVPFTALEIKPTQFVSTASTFKLDDMTLSGIIPIAVTGSPYFGYDPGQKHWALSIAPKQGESSCAYFTNLPGMKNGEKIYVNNFFLLSNGDDGFAIDPNTPSLTFYDVGTFKPTMMSVYGTYIHIPGTMDVHIPNVVGQSTAIDFKKNSQGDLAMTIQPFPFGFSSNGLSLSFLANGAYPETLDKNGFNCRGTVEEAGKFKFDVMLHKTKDSISVWIEPNQALNITQSGSSKFTKVAGSMRVENGSWTNLWFAGDLTGAEGASGRITFTVIGDVLANQQQVGLQNIPTPFGNIALVFDFENSRLLGTVDFSDGIDLGGALAKGTAEMLVDGTGWYFLTCGTLGITGVEVQAGMLFGSYPVTPSISEKFKKFSWVYQNKGAFPPSFPTTVQGFYMEGLLQIPVLIPNYEFDFILISGSLHVNVGADMRLAMNFNDNASFGLGQSVYGEVGVGIGGSVIIACAGVSASMKVDVGFDGVLYKNGNYLLQADAALTLCGSAYCGWGVCDSDCDGMFCDKSEEGGCIGLGVRGTMSSSAKNIEFYLK